MITDEIRKLRKTGLGGSDIGAVMGLSPYTTPRDVYLAKTESDKQEEDNGTSESIYWGTVLEDVIIDRFCQEHPKVSVERSPEMFRHIDNEWMLANLDGILYMPDKSQGVLEIKTAGSFNAKNWGTEGTGDIPKHYEMQVRWYMAVMDMDFAIVAVLIAGQDYREYRIERDAEIEAQMIEAGRKFWFDYVKKGIEPPPSSRAEALKILSEKADDGSEIQAEAETLGAYQKLKDIKKKIKELTTEAEVYEEIIKERIGESSVMAYDGKPIVTWKIQESTRFDQKLFKETHPDLYEEFVFKSTSRRFILK